MPSFEPADIFFVITSIGVIAVSVIAVWIGILIIRTLRNIQYISGLAREESTTALRFFYSLGKLFTRSTKKKKK